MAETDIDKLSKDDFKPASEAAERGYSGYTPDDTPNEAYTVAGVTDAKSPATDADQSPQRKAAAPQTTKENSK